MTYESHLFHMILLTQFLSVDLRCHGDSASISKRGPHTVAAAALDVLKLVRNPRALFNFYAYVSYRSSFSKTKKRCALDFVFLDSIHGSMDSKWVIGRVILLCQAKNNCLKVFQPQLLTHKTYCVSFFYFSISCIVLYHIMYRKFFIL